MNFLVSSTSFSFHAHRLLTSLVQAVLKTNPQETLKYLLPKIFERVESIFQQSESTIYIDHQGDPELTWSLAIFSELVRARGDSLLPYKSMILSIFKRTIRLIKKDYYETLSTAARYLLKSLSYVYPIDYRLTVENIEEPFTDFLPIRVSIL